MDTNIIKEFEDSLSQVGSDSGINYYIDTDMELKIKYEYLCDNWGKENVDLFVNDITILAKPEDLAAIVNKLEENK